MALAFVYIGQAHDSHLLVPLGVEVGEYSFFGKVV